MVRRKHAMPYLRIQRLWTDSDEMLQLEVTASNDVQVGKQDFYAYPETITEFGKKLMEFPKPTSDTVAIEYGAEPNYYCYFRLSAVVLNSRGHSALEVEFQNRLDPPAKAECHFYLPCEPATVNEFGKQLLAWSKHMKEPLHHEWRNA